MLAVHRPTTNVIFGDGLSNDSVSGSSDPYLNGLSIDSSWLSIYQDQGIVGDLLVGAIFVLLLLTALFRARGPTRALALFLIVYCLIAGINESGLGDASPYLLDLTVAASLITFPSAMGTDLTFGPMQPDKIPTASNSSTRLIAVVNVHSSPWNDARSSTSDCIRPRYSGIVICCKVDSLPAFRRCGGWLTQCVGSRKKG